MLPAAAVDHYQVQQAIAVTAGKTVQRLWRGGVGDDFEIGWSRIGQDVFQVVAGAQAAAAANGIGYVPTVLTEQGLDATSVASVDASRFAGGTADGRPLETLLHGATVEAKRQIALGIAVTAAVTAAGRWIVDTTLDQIRDADRQAVTAVMAVTPAATGWVRMLNPPSCKFCVLLAGKWYRWNQGFDAHNRCDCRHIPALESAAGDLTVDPVAYFRSLDRAGQDRVFGKNDAEAIRAGGDMSRIVNTRIRGVANSRLKGTAGRNRGWQARRWDSPSLLTVDDVIAAAGGDRTRTIELLRANRYITGDPVAEGNLIGNQPSAFGDLAAGQMGRGGTRRGATLATRQAARTGVRDPLEPATQTAAERRLHLAHLRHEAVRAGRNPFAGNSTRTPLTDRVRDLVERQYAREIARLDTAPAQVQDLARLLGIR